MPIKANVDKNAAEFDQLNEISADDLLIIGPGNFVEVSLFLVSLSSGSLPQVWSLFGFVVNALWCTPLQPSRLKWADACNLFVYSSVICFVKRKEEHFSAIYKPKTKHFYFAVMRIYMNTHTRKVVLWLYNPDRPVVIVVIRAHPWVLT